MTLLTINVKLQMMKWGRIRWSR